MNTIITSLHKLNKKTCYKVRTMIIASSRVTFPVYIDPWIVDTKKGRLLHPPNHLTIFHYVTTSMENESLMLMSSSTVFNPFQKMVSSSSSPSSAIPIIRHSPLDDV